MKETSLGRLEVDDSYSSELGKRRETMRRLSVGLKGLSSEKSGAATWEDSNGVSSSLFSFMFPPKDQSDLSDSEMNEKILECLSKNVRLMGENPGEKLTEAITKMDKTMLFFDRTVRLTETEGHRFVSTIGYRELMAKILEMPVMKGQESVVLKGLRDSVALEKQMETTNRKGVSGRRVSQMADYLVFLFKRFGLEKEANELDAAKKDFDLSGKSKKRSPREKALFMSRKEVVRAICHSADVSSLKGLVGMGEGLAVDLRDAMLSLDGRKEFYLDWVLKSRDPEGKDVTACLMEADKLTDFDYSDLPDILGWQENPFTAALRRWNNRLSEKEPGAYVMKRMAGDFMEAQGEEECLSLLREAREQYPRSDSLSEACAFIESETFEKEAEVNEKTRKFRI